MVGSLTHESLCVKVVLDKNLRLHEAEQIMWVGVSVLICVLMVCMIGTVIDI